MTIRERNMLIVFISIIIVLIGASSFIIYNVYKTKTLCDCNCNDFCKNNEPQVNNEIPNVPENKKCTINCLIEDNVCGENNITYGCGLPEATCNNIKVLYNGTCTEYLNKNYLQLEQYIKDNISTLSPEKEVLGGKFYVTNIKWKDDNNAIVDYEDGHIAFRATINILIEKDEKNENKIVVKSFDIVKK